MFPELIVGVAEWIFCYKEGILMKTDPFSQIYVGCWIFCYNEWRYKEFDCSSALIVCGLYLIKLVEGAYGTTRPSSLSALDIGKL